MGSHSVADEHICTTGHTFCQICGKLVDRDALRSIGFRPTNPGAKTTVDVHDTHKVEVTEHWDDRVDVTAKMETQHFKGPDAELVKGPSVGGG